MYASVLVLTHFSCLLFWIWIIDLLGYFGKINGIWDIKVDYFMGYLGVLLMGCGIWDIKVDYFMGYLGVLLMGCGIFDAKFTGIWDIGTPPPLNKPLYWITKNCVCLCYWATDCGLGTGISKCELKVTEIVCLFGFHIHPRTHIYCTHHGRGGGVISLTGRAANSGPVFG